MYELTECRICKSKDLKVFLDLGDQPLANSFIEKKDLRKKEQKYPLKVAFCNNCNLCQLTHVVSPEVLFKNYVYFSSGMPVLPQHFKDYANDAIFNFLASKNDLVIEIGSNDGLLLNEFKEQGYRILGVDPATNIAKVANKRGVETIDDFFSFEISKRIKLQNGQAKIIIGNNVVAHIDDHHDLLKGIKNLLDKEGVFIFEAPYLLDMFENLTFDTIYHEHLSYLAIRPLKSLFEQFGMEIFDVKLFPVQGQSIRVFAGIRGAHKINKSVSQFVKNEVSSGLDKYSSYLALARKIDLMKQSVVDKLHKLKNEGKSIAGYGAPAKGNTLLNYYQIGPNILDYATEGLPSKIGLYTPGTHIPVIDITESRKSPPDYYFLLAWNYKDAICQKEAKFLENGGKFIMPIGREYLKTKAQKKRPAKTVLVTGGAGYIGSVLVPELLKKGYRVKILDNLIFTDRFLNGTTAEIFKNDVREINDSILKNVDAIIHLAGFSTEPTAQYDPRLTDYVNHIATESLALAAKKNGIERFIYASTASVYFTFNTPLEPPLYKENDQVNPISSYSITKRCSEQALLEMTDGAFQPTIFRKGTVYGFSPRMRYDLVFNSLTKDAYTKGLLTVDAGGEIWRPMIDIKDLVNIYTQCLELPVSKVGGKIFNVSDENWKIGDLALLIKDFAKSNFGKTIALDIKPYGITRNYKMDNTSFVNTFGFKKGRNMEDTFKEIWEHLENDSFHKDTAQPIFYNDKWYQLFFDTNEGKKFKTLKIR